VRIPGRDHTGNSPQIAGAMIGHITSVAGAPIALGDSRDPQTSVGRVEAGRGTHWRVETALNERATQENGDETMRRSI
jgi:hypothetical protein